ncbi:MAG: 7TM-DISM domain-containing protein, partial [Bacteroidota bacterium]
MRKTARKIMRLALIFFVGLPFYIQAADHPPAVKQGHITILRDHLQDENTLAIDGEWEFYWRRLLTPDSFAIRSIVPQFQFVPSKWNLYVVNGKDIPVRGFATYRLTIHNPDKIDDLMIKIPGIATACRIWVNGILKQTQGNVAVRAEDSKPRRLHNFILLPADETITLVVEASNYEYSVPGISHTVIAAHEEVLIDREDLAHDFEMIEIGCLLIMIFYHLALYFQLGRNTSYLLLSLLCTVVLIRASATYHSSLILFRLFPSIEFSSIKKFEFGFTYASLFLLPMFVRSLFQKDTPLWSIRIFQVVGGLLCLLVVATTPDIFGQALDFYHLMMTLAFILTLWVIVKAIRRKRDGAWIIFTGILLCSVFVEFEMLMVSGIIPERLSPFPNTVGAGVVIFLLFQSIGLSVRFAKAFKDVEELTHTLEKRVEKRTEELSRANLVKDKMFSIISHDL